MVVHVVFLPQEIQRACALAGMEVEVVPVLAVGCTVAVVAPRATLEGSKMPPPSGKCP